MDRYTYYVFPLTDEAYLEQGYVLKFNSDMHLEHQKAIAKMPESPLRPTIIKIRHHQSDQLLFIGGLQSRQSLRYDPSNDTWHYAARLPETHNFSSFLSCNYNNEAVFTFMTDAQLNFKAAVMDLHTVEDSTQEMPYALKMLQSAHKIDRFHFKNAVALPPQKQICVVARGRVDQMK